MPAIFLLCQAKNFTLADDGTASTIQHNKDFSAVDWRTFLHSVMGIVGWRLGFDNLAVFPARAYLVDEVRRRGHRRSTERWRLETATLISPNLVRQSKHRYSKAIQGKAIVLERDLGWGIRCR
jgi:hypothetical protein